MTRAPTAEEAQVLRALSGHHEDTETILEQLARRGTPRTMAQLSNHLTILTRLMYVSRTGLRPDVHYAITCQGEDALSLLVEVAA